MRLSVDLQLFSTKDDRLLVGDEMESQRYAQRFGTREKASIEVYGRAGTVIADLKNISASGACVEWTQGDVTINRGDVVRLTVFLRALNRKHNLSAEVIWRDGNRSGISFLKADQVLSKMAAKT